LSLCCVVEPFEFSKVETSRIQFDDTDVSNVAVLVELGRVMAVALGAGKVVCVEIVDGGVKSEGGCLYFVDIEENKSGETVEGERIRFERNVLKVDVVSGVVGGQAVVDVNTVLGLMVVGIGEVDVRTMVVSAAIVL